MNNKFSIAVGRSRKDVRWKNEQWTWSDFLARIKNTHRTHESYAEYCAAKKTRQDEIKDVGGFVGGRLAGGRRLASAVVCRQLVALDIDFSQGGVWDAFTFLYDNAAALYTTHKHSPETPRYRLILPLDREVTADEYVPIARRIAGMLGIELFDPTTYEPSRLMYWPSTSADGVYEMYAQDGDWLSADEILASYRDWRDVSEWPISLREHDINAHAIKKQGDPHEKPGVVGAFCREFDIHSVIETYLSDVYEPEGEDRYSFKGGTTTAGLVLYRDGGIAKFAYSHHGTDPCSGKLSNAFDLVRLHKFGAMDEDCRESTPIQKRPSFAAMRDLALKNKEVKYRMSKERFAEALSDFEDDEEATSDEWLKDLDLDNNGKCQNTINNVVLILENDPKLKGCFGYDAFKERAVVLKDLPWRKVKEYPWLRDADEAHLMRHMEVLYGITLEKAVRNGLQVHIDSNTFHPVREYLAKLRWDGEPRLDTLFIDFLGAEDNIYVRAATRKAFAAAVARIRIPGIKFDVMPVLISENQGIGKSTLLKYMGKEIWFSDSFGDVRNDSAAQQLNGTWIMEVGELAKMKNADVDAVKLFLSKQEDTYRPAYGRNYVTKRRQTIIFATANEANFLKDKTGNRRFWPIMCGVQPIEKSVFTELEPWYVDQVWAEAVEVFESGEELFMSGDLHQIALKVQAAHEEIDDRVGRIKEFLERKIPQSWYDMDDQDKRNWLLGFRENDVDEPLIYRSRICAAEIWVELFGGSLKDMTPYNMHPIHNILKRLEGWKCISQQRVKNYGRQVSYERVMKEYEI